MHLIIGGTSGIGLNWGKRLAKQGKCVSVVGRRIPAEPNDDLHSFQLDLLNTEEIPSTIKRIVEAHGPLSNLYFFQRYRGGENFWAGEMAITLTATSKIIESAMPHFKGSAENPSIVMIGSYAGKYVAEEQLVGYHVACAGMNQMMRYYAVSLGERGIRVNSVSFGTVFKEATGVSLLKNRELCALYETVIPLRRLGTERDVLDALEFLISSKASFITGQELVLDGGLSLLGHEVVARKAASLNHIKLTR